MDTRNVIPLNKIIGVNFPVRIKYESLGRYEFDTLHGFVLHLFDRGTQLLEQRRFRFNANENKSTPGFHGYFKQWPLIKIEAASFAKIRRADELAAQVVHPVVVRAAQPLNGSDPAIQQQRATVSADISKAAQLTGVVPDDENVGTGNVGRNVLPRCA